MSKINDILSNESRVGKTATSKILYDAFNKNELIDNLILKSKGFITERNTADSLRVKKTQLETLNKKLENEAGNLRKAKLFVDGKLERIDGALGLSVSKTSDLEKTLIALDKESKNHFALYQNERLLNNSRKQDMLDIVNGSGNVINMLKGLVNMFDSTQSRVAGNEERRLKSEKGTK